MLILKKFLLIHSVISIPLVATVLTSCSTVGEIDQTLASQLELLTSVAAQEEYKNIWSKDTFAELYLRSEYKDKEIVPSVFKVEKDIIKKYLKYLIIPTPSSVDMIAGEPIQTILMKIHTKLFDSYKFFTAWKSSSDPLYFINQRSNWIDKNLVFKDPNDGSITSITKFKQYFAYYSGLFIHDPNPKKFEEDFELLYKIKETGIQTELLNMMIAVFYFTTSTSDIIGRGTDYNNVIDTDVNSLNYWEAKSFDVNSPTYFLEKYLVSKSPRIKWNYASDDANKISDLTNTVISNPFNYNELWLGNNENISIITEPIFSNDLVVKSNDKEFNNDILNFKGYNSSIELLGASLNGDLSTDADAIRRFSSPKSGLFNNETNKLVSFDNLNIVEKIKKNNNAITSASNVHLVPITLSNLSSIIRKKSHQISSSDLLINDKEFELGDVLTEETTTEIHKWKLDEIIPILNSSVDQQSIQLNMSYDYYNKLNSTWGFSNYKYEVIITWKQTTSPNDSNIISELETKFDFSDFNTPFGKQNVVGINPIVEGKVNVSYYIRLFPNFLWNESPDGIKEVRIIDDNPKAIGIFTMAGTPWGPEPANKKNLQNLIFSLYLNDAELFNGIKNILVLNDMAILPGDVKEVNSILQELGILYIDKKPDYSKPILK